MSQAELEWYTRPRDIITGFRKFWPTPNQTSAEQLNSIVRLLAYSTFGAYVYNKNMKTLFLGVAVIALVSFLFSRRQSTRTAGTMYRATERRMPTKDNPFMNTTVDQFGKPQPPPPAEYKDVQTQMRDAFNDGLFRNLDDVYEMENSQRQFYTLPTAGNVPDTQKFAEFLYGSARNCKSNPGQCTGNEV